MSKNEFSIGRDRPSTSTLEQEGWVLVAEFQEQRGEAGHRKEALVGPLSDNGFRAGLVRQHNGETCSEIYAGFGPRTEIARFVCDLVEPR